MMQESFIHLPVIGNNGENIVTQIMAIESQIMDTFGGLTMQTARGMWRDPQDGKVYAEQVQRYAVAAVWDATAITKLHDIAMLAAVSMQQVCIYMATPGGVEFVGPSTFSIAAE